MVVRADLTDEEWESLQRLDRGPPESSFVPGTILARLIEIGLAGERGGRRRVSEAGKRLILRDKHESGR